MEKDKVMEMSERFKVKASVFCKNNIPTFISDINDNYFFCHIQRVENDFLVVKGFSGKRNGEIDRIFFIDIVRFEEFLEKKEDRE